MHTTVFLGVAVGSVHRTGFPAGAIVLTIP